MKTLVKQVPSPTPKRTTVSKHAWGSKINKKWDGSDYASTATDTAGGVLGGMATGAALGTVAGLPGIVIGGILGGGIGLIKGITGSNNKARSRASLLEANRQQTIQNMDNRIASDSNIKYLNAPTTFYLRGGRLYAEGGAIPNMQPLSHDTELAVGPSHEGGGIQYGPNDEIEGGETTMKKPSETLVFSDRVMVPGTNMTFAEATLPLMKKKGELELKFSKIEEDINKELGTSKQPSANILKRNSSKRRAEIGGIKSQKVLAEVGMINSQLEQLFALQEQINGNQSNEEGTQMMANGGTIHADGSSIPYFDQHFGKQFNTIVKKPAKSNTPIPFRNESSVTSDTPKTKFGGADSQFLLQAGADLFDTVSQTINSSAMAKLPLPTRAMVRPMRMSNYVDNSKELSDIDANVASTKKFITDNVRNPQVRRAAMINVMAKANAAKNTSFLNKFKFETAIEAENTKMTFDSILRNNESSFANSTDSFNQAMAANNRASQLSANFADKIGNLGVMKAQSEQNDVALGAILTQYPEPVRRAILKSMQQGKSFRQSLLTV